MKAKVQEKIGINPWPIAIVGYFVCFMAATVIFIGFALRNSMDLVRADYYDQEILYGNQMDRMRLGESVSRQVRVAWEADTRSLVIDLPESHIGRISSGIVHLYRPSNAEWDRHVPMLLDTTGRQSLDVTGIQPGFWKVRLHWTMDGREFYLDRSLVIEAAKSS